ncbi:GNAT family N-acetyltransferase [Ruminococcus sp.]|nr:GNAT family N-acetyltransferase [Ruminococcus sp.]HNZ98203.1 GNAT family N-acetyltransferase [Ruminococcus sp.]
MKSFNVYEMEFRGEASAPPDISLIRFSEEYYPQYEQIYNECFYEMRKALDVKPYDFYNDISQLKEKAEHIYLLFDGNTIIGSVGCFGTVIDDFIVNSAYQGRGYGRKLLLWAINHIRSYTEKPITLTVAQWNSRAVQLYESTGFVIIKIRTIT